MCDGMPQREHTMNERFVYIYLSNVIRFPLYSQLPPAGGTLIVWVVPDISRTWQVCCKWTSSFICIFVVIGFPCSKYPKNVTRSSLHIWESNKPFHVRMIYGRPITRRFPLMLFGLFIYLSKISVKYGEIYTRFSAICHQSNECIFGGVNNPSVAFCKNPL